MTIFIKESTEERIEKRKELISEEELGKYQKWFKSKMKSITGKDKITDMSDEEKKKFFNFVDSNWKAKEESD